jgi:hypothetical protein
MGRCAGKSHAIRRNRTQWHDRKHKNDKEIKRKRFWPLMSRRMGKISWKATGSLKKFLRLHSLFRSLDLQSVVETTRLFRPFPET